MFDWLRSILPHMPHYGYALVFIVVFLNNIGFPLPGETILLGAGFILGKTASTLWPPLVAGAVACFLGGICSFWMGRRLGHSGLEKIHWLHLTPERLQWPERFFKRYGAKAVFIARFIALFPPVVANLLAGMSKNTMAHFPFFQPHGVGGLCHRLHPAWVFFWEEVEAASSLVRPDDALPDSHGDSPHCSGRAV